MQFWAINVFCNYKLHWAFKCYLLMVRDLLSPAMKLVGSLLIWRIYLFILAKNEAVVCNGCVFLECHLLADTNKKEKQWSTESTLWCLLWCLFFLHIVLKSDLGALNVPTQTAGSSEAEPCACAGWLLWCAAKLWILALEITSCLSKSQSPHGPHMCRQSSASLSCFRPHSTALGISVKNTKYFDLGTLLFCLQHIQALNLCSPK